MAINKEYIIIIVLFFIIIYFTLFHKAVETYYDPKINTIKENLLLVDPEVASKLNIQAGNVSFTENKKDMYLCLKDKKVNTILIICLCMLPFTNLLMLNQKL